MSTVLLGGAQLAPVYKPFGGGGDKDGKSIEQPEDPRSYNDVPRPQVDAGGRTAFVTKTVYGFLDFTTTVGSTIMVFSPKSGKTVGLTRPLELKADGHDGQKLEGLESFERRSCVFGNAANEHAEILMSCNPEAEP